MKTTVSIPDALFEEADTLARQRGIPRSRLYAAALQQYLASHASGDPRHQEEDSILDPFLTYAAVLTFKRAEW